MPKRNLTLILDRIIESAVLVCLFTLPFSKTIVEGCIAVAIIAFLVKKFFIEKSLKLEIDKKVLAGLFLFSLFNVVSLYNTAYLDRSIVALFSKVLKWVMLFIVIAETIKTPAQLKRLFTTMLCSVALIMADAIYQQYVTGMDFLHWPNRYPVFKIHHRQYFGTTFPTASFPYPNDFAAWILINIFTFIALLTFDLKNNKKFRYTALALSTLLVIFFFLASSRGAMVGAAVAMVLLAFINIKKLIKPIAAVCGILLLLIIFVPYLNVYLREGILDVKLSVDDRVNMWSTGWRIFKAHPVIGNGVNTFFEHYKHFRDDEDRGKAGSYAHNCYLQMAVDIGALGLGAFLYLIFATLYSNAKRALKSRGSFEGSFVIGLSLGVVAFIVHSFFDTNLYSLNLAALFWVSMGLIQAIGSRINEA